MMKWFKQSGVKLAFIFAITTTVLLLLLNVIVSRRGEDIFVGVAHTIPYQFQGLSGSFDPSQFQIEVPRQLFTDQFRVALEWVTLIGIILSALLGAAIGSAFITQPLRRLQHAIENLKNRKFIAELEPTGLPEFDLVLQDFNDLAHELDRVEQLRRDLISDTSHELKTPIASLLVQLEGIRDGILNVDPERIETLLKQAHRLDDLTERLQEYTRLRNRTISMKRTEVILKPLLESLIREHREELTKKKLTAILDISDTYSLMADRHLLEQLFINLLRNTITYANAHEIHIEATAKTIRYSDDGKGVPEDALPNLFERFYRVDQSRNRQHGGLGLGLAIVHEIVEAHGWQITAENKPSGGLCLTLHLQ